MGIIRRLLDIVCITVAFIILLVAGMYYKDIRPFVIVSGSMNPKIPIGSICFIDTQYSFQKIKVNDIIMYQAPNQRVVHRVVEKKEASYKTKGDANQKIDRAEITKDIYLGKYLFSVPKVGYVTRRLQKPVNKGIFVTCLLALYIIDYLMHYAKSTKKCKE